MRLFIPTVVAAFALGSPVAAAAAEIRIWAARAIATVLDEVGGEFERATGHRLIVTSDLPPAFLRRASAGEPFDLLISGSSPVDEWIREGRLLAGTRTAIARSGIGVAVRAGASKPDLGTVDAFTRAVMNATSIAYLRVGSGVYLDALFRRLGIANAIELKAVRPDADIVSELVAKGQVELGIVVITQILTTPGARRPLARRGAILRHVRRRHQLGFHVAGGSAGADRVSRHACRDRGHQEAGHGARGTVGHESRCDVPQAMDDDGRGRHRRRRPVVATGSPAARCVTRAHGADRARHRRIRGSGPPSYRHGRRSPFR
jgi:molybdate transport system substrate-binding protein